MDVSFSGDIWHWRGPSPYHFVTVPEQAGARLREVAAAVTYGWGMVPVLVHLGGTEWETSLFPKNGGYLVPIKDAVRRDERLDVGDTVMLRLTIDVPG